MKKQFTREEQQHHEHPLQLIDMQPQYPHYEEEFDDGCDDGSDDVGDGEDDLSKKWDFCRPCNLCGREIRWYHRYCYKCKDSCDYWLHKFCGEIPTTLTHRSHRALNHTLTLAMSSLFFCGVCKSSDFFKVDCYLCRDCDCEIGIHVNCILKQEENHPIYHPSHPHPLVLLTSEPILCKCDACGKKHMGMFYQCTTPLHFSIHSDCAFLPKMLSTQHTHPLALSYSFPWVDQAASFFPRCRKCGDVFDDQNLWMYKCEKCRYYVHLDCATSRGEPFMSIFKNPGFGKLVKNFKDADYPGLLNLPFRDQTFDMLKHLYFKESGDTTNERNLSYSDHRVPLIMVGDENLSSCHNPVKKIELLCNGCIRPIMNTPFYKSGIYNEFYQFVIHEWCTLLPPKLLDYPGHPDHKLIFLPDFSNYVKFSIFNCRACGFHCNGFAYGCIECEYYIDVTCGLLPKNITHEAHPGHLLTRGMQGIPDEDNTCLACGGGFFAPDFHVFACHTCKIFLHPECALLLPSMITHRLDKHSLKLRYEPVENHKSEYFCEVCEEELNPNHWFYHCDVCVQSMHSYCFPIITECQRAIRPKTFGYADGYGGAGTGVFSFFKVKYKGSYEHSLSFFEDLAQTVVAHSASVTKTCNKDLKNKMIFKCLKCKFAIHCRCV